jgi:glycosyltransferase involved in cell wall biosynthesis
VNDGTEFSKQQVHDIRNLVPKQVELIILQAGGVGGSAARNLGLAKVSTSIVTYLDDDNLMFVGWIRTVAKCAKNTEFSLIYGAQSRQDTPSHFVGRNFSLEALKVRNFIDTGMIAHRSDIGRWDPQLKRFVDWDFVLGIALDQKNVVKFVPRFASCYLDDAPQRASVEISPHEWELFIRSKHGINSDPQYT